MKPYSTTLKKSWYNEFTRDRRYIKNEFRESNQIKVAI